MTSLTYGKDVRRQCSQRLALVLFDDVCRVELPHVLVRVHRQQDVGYVCLKYEETGDDERSQITTNCASTTAATFRDNMES